MRVLTVVVKKLISPFLLFATLLVMPGAGVVDLQAQSTNLEQISSTARLIADSVLRDTRLPDTLCLNVVTHPADWIVLNAFTDRSHSFGRATVRCTPPFRRELLIAITEIDVIFETLNDDEIRRTVQLSIALSLPQIVQAEEIRLTDRRSVQHVDTVDSDVAGSLVSSGYPFTSPRYITSTPSSFWQRIAEPALVLGTTVGMVVLLFTTRS